MEITFSDSSGTELIIQGRCVRPSEVSSIWYRRPEHLRTPLSKDSPEAQFSLNEWTEALESFFAQVPAYRWINHPSHNAAASNKLEQLVTARRLGLETPNSIVTHDLQSLRQFFEHQPGKIIAKPLSSGYVERSDEEDGGLIYTNLVALQDIDNASEIASCPTLFQSYVDKRFDVRITILDGAIHAVAMTAIDSKGNQRCDIRRDNMRGVRYEVMDPPEDVSAKLFRMMDYYELRFGAIDMVVDSHGCWHFLEINPNGQWAWLDQHAGTRIASSFVASAKSA